MSDLEFILRELVREGLSDLTQEVRRLTQEVRRLGHVIPGPPPAAAPRGPVTYTTDEVAEMFSVAPKSVRRWIGEGRLKAHKFGRSYVILEADLERFYNSEFNPPGEDE